MKIKKLKAVVSAVLVASMFFSQISVSALEVDNKDNSLSESKVTDQSTSQSTTDFKEDQLINEEFFNDASSSQEKSINNQDTKENNTKQDTTEKNITDQKEIYNSNFQDEKIEEKSLIGEKYEVKKEDSSLGYSRIQTYEREEFNLKQKTFTNVEELEKKTDANYEVALAHSDGSYSYVGSAEDVQEAMDKVESIDLNNASTLGENMSKVKALSLTDYAAKTMNAKAGNTVRLATYTAASNENQDAVPVILNGDGKVVYSTKSMGRILKHINGKVYGAYDKNTNIYSNASLTKAFTYVNHGYVDDVPIIEDNGTSAKILISGYEGWINKDQSSSEYDMIVVPINQVTNPSYYISENGVLSHFISLDLKATTGIGTKLEIGTAPSYLKNGVKYLSYDGKYFYEGSDIAKGLNNLIADLQNGTHENAINANNPNYTYFNYLPFRSKSNYTAADIDKFISGNTQATSKLRGTGAAFKEVENAYGVNALLALGIAINESGWGMSSISQNKNNIFGINAVDSNPGQAADTYSTVKDSIYDFSKNIISKGYADPAFWAYYGGFLGNKSLCANVKYASDPFWGEKASRYAFLADYYLAGKSTSNLVDNNHYQLGIYVGTGQVTSAKGDLLYKVIDNFLEYADYVGGSVIVNSNNNGVYEINPQRNTPVSKGGWDYQYHGNYNFNDKGYVSANAIKLVNTPISTGEWVYKGGKWYYSYSEGNVAKGWLEVKGKKYYLDETTGEMKTGWVSYNNKMYYFFSDGTMAVNGWVLSGSKWYYVYADGTMATGWVSSGRDWYYMYSNGQMATGWVLSGGSWYYMYSSGQMATGWVLSGNDWYYMYGSGQMATGWIYSGGAWYYLYGSGQMSKGWVYTGGAWYYMYSNGKMATGWIYDGSGWYYLQSNGKLA